MQNTTSPTKGKEATENTNNQRAISTIPAKSKRATALFPDIEMAHARQDGQRGGTAGV